MDKHEIIRAIRETPLSDQDLTDIIAMCTMVTMGNALVGAGMDMLAGKLDVALEEYIGREEPT